MNYPLIMINDSHDGGVEEKKDDEPVTLSLDRHLPQSNGLHHHSTGHYNNHNGVQHQINDGGATAANSRNQQPERHNDTGGFHTQIQNLVRTIVESCESIVTFFVRGGEGGCPPWTGNSNRNEKTPNHYHRHTTAGVGTGVVLQQQQHPPQPLSITEELRKLAELEGRVFGGGMRRRNDIPRFLGEDAVYSFDNDDNISAISQHTLEEMMIKHVNMKQQQHQPVLRRKLSSESSSQQSTASSLQQTPSAPSPTLPVPVKVELLHVHEEREGIV